MPDMLAEVSRRVGPLPKDMEELMPDLLPKTMDSLMPNLLPLLVPHITPLMIEYIKTGRIPTTVFSVAETAIAETAATKNKKNAAK